VTGEALLGLMSAMLTNHHQPMNWQEMPNDLWRRADESRPIETSIKAPVAQAAAAMAGYGVSCRDRCGTRPQQQTKTRWALVQATEAKLPTVATSITTAAQTTAP
jgi:hypothetical protein